jgi:hypothetical protein
MFVARSATMGPALPTDLEKNDFSRSSGTASH